MKKFLLFLWIILSLFYTNTFANSVLNVYTWNFDYASPLSLWNILFASTSDSSNSINIYWFNKNWNFHDGLGSLYPNCPNVRYWGRSHTSVEKHFLLSYSKVWQNKIQFISFSVWNSKYWGWNCWTDWVYYSIISTDENWTFIKKRIQKSYTDFNSSLKYAYSWYKLYFYNQLKNSNVIRWFYIDFTSWYSYQYFEWVDTDLKWIVLINNSILYPVWNKLLNRKYNYVASNSSWFVSAYDLKVVQVPVSYQRTFSENSFLFSDFPYSYVYKGWNLTYLSWFVFKNWNAYKVVNYDTTLYSGFSYWDNGLFYWSKILSWWIAEIDEISINTQKSIPSLFPVSDNNWNNNWNDEKKSPYTSNINELNIWYVSEWNIPYLFKWKYYNNKNQLFLPYYTTTWNVVDLWFNLQEYFTWYNGNSTWLDSFSYNISWFNSYNPAYFGWACSYNNSNTSCVLYDYWNDKNYTYFYDITWAIFFYQTKSDFSKWNKTLCFVKNHNVSCLIPTNISHPLVQSNWNYDNWSNNLNSSWTLVGLSKFNNTVCPVSWHFLNYINPTIWWFRILGWTAPAYHPLWNFACLFNIIGWAYDWKINLFNIHLGSWSNVINSSVWWKLNNYHWPWFGDIVILLIIFSLGFQMLFGWIWAWDTEGGWWFTSDKSDSGWSWWSGWFKQKSLRKKGSIWMPSHSDEELHNRVAWKKRKIDYEFIQKQVKKE